MSTLLYERESHLISCAYIDIHRQSRGNQKKAALKRALLENLRADGLEAISVKKKEFDAASSTFSSFIPDIIVNKTILITLKAKTHLSPDDENRFEKYVCSSGYKLGFLVNFGPGRLQVCRRVCGE